MPNGYETTLTTRLGRTTKYRVQDQPNGDLVRTHTDPAGNQSSLEVRQDGSRKATSADGTVTRTQRGPDPRFEMQASILRDFVLETPDGRTLDLDGSRQATGGPLSLQSQTDTLDVNGRRYTTAYDGSQDRFTRTTPQNRSSTTAIDDQGRPTRSESPDLHPLTTTYLGDGRLETEKQGPDNDPTKQRVWHYTYESPSGFLNTVTDPLNRTTAFDYDLAGRVTKRVLPGNREVLFDYDANGNLRSVTPPSRPAHVFDHNAVDLLTTYDPPNVGFTPTTTYEYNHDQDLTRILRPDGREISFTYEPTKRRLDYFTQPSGQTDIDYDPATGNISTVTAPGSEGMALAYDGALPKRETYTGTVNASASRTYDNDLRLASTSVNDAHTANYSYDGDSLLEQAGDLDLHRDTESGLLTGSTLGSTETTVVPNGFGEPDSISGRFGTQTLYSATFLRDNLGRIQQKTETTSQGTRVYVYDYDYDAFLSLAEAERVALVAAIPELKDLLFLMESELAERVPEQSGCYTPWAKYDARELRKSDPDLAALGISQFVIGLHKDLPYVTLFWIDDAGQDATASFYNSVDDAMLYAEQQWDIQPEAWTTETDASA